ncbi:MAG: hypothetical protein M3503_02015, partial [Actinomycetota bacterium]|nr:hypothetical protein [Actinomycetota bacterium]
MALLRRDATAQPPEVATEAARARQDDTNLKLVLIATDATVVTVAWLLWAALATTPAPFAAGPLRAAVLAGVLTMLSLGGFRLYRSRVCSVHAVEIAGIGKAAALAAVGVQAFQGAVGA